MSLKMKIHFQSGFSFSSFFLFQGTCPFFQALTGLIPFFATIKGLWNSYGDVWIIDTKGLSNKWWYDLYFRKGDNKIMTFDSIPPNHLHLVESYDDDEENDLQKRVESTVKKLSKKRKFLCYGGTR